MVAKNSETPEQHSNLQDLPSLKKFNCSTFVVHPDMIGQDWKPIKIGTPVLISTDGHNEVVHLKLPESVKKQFPAEKEFCPAFINEAAYQEGGVAFSLYTSTSLVVL